MPSSTWRHWSGPEAEPSRSRAAKAVSDARSAVLTRLWPRWPHSSLTSGLLGLEGISKRKTRTVAPGEAADCSSQGPDLCGRQAGGKGFPAHS
jgi:hypothetical protein